jgi:OTT_1508-like deaminase
VCLSKPTTAKRPQNASSDEEAHDLDFEPEQPDQIERDEDDKVESKTLDAVMQDLDINSEQDGLPNGMKEEVAIELAKRQKLYPIVHSEVQIMSYLVKEDLLEKTLGYLGSSKHACFMCNLFCQSFGVETRGCDYDQYSVWKTPILDQLNTGQVAKLVNAILETEKSLQGQLGTPVAHPLAAAKSLDIADETGNGSGEIKVSRLMLAGTNKILDMKIFSTS